MVILGIDLGPHWPFIVLAFAMAAAVVLGLVSWVVLDHRTLRRTLADLESRGIRRRSSPTGGEQR